MVSGSLLMVMHKIPFLRRSTNDVKGRYVVKRASDYQHSLVKASSSVLTPLSLTPQLSSLMPQPAPLMPKDSPRTCNPWSRMPPARLLQSLFSESLQLLTRLFLRGLRASNYGYLMRPANECSSSSSCPRAWSFTFNILHSLRTLVEPNPTNQIFNITSLRSRSYRDDTAHDS